MHRRARAEERSLVGRPKHETGGLARDGTAMHFVERGSLLPAAAWQAETWNIF